MIGWKQRNRRALRWYLYHKWLFTTPRNITTVIRSTQLQQNTSRMFAFARLKVKKNKLVLVVHVKKAIDCMMGIS